LSGGSIPSPELNAELNGWYSNKRVLVTGHTGFKGAWLVAWLRRAGADVTGYSLAPRAGELSLFSAARLEEGIDSVIGDVRDGVALSRAFQQAAPEIVFHLAAQSLVRPSFRDPVTTYETNVMGTVNVLDLARQTSSVQAVVVVTSDKCYELDRDDHAYRETDRVGGHDPYSSSKGCAELVTSAMRRSFFGSGAAVASARAGNVIGGGDWSEDRLVPDVMTAAAAGAVTPLRHPEAVRPWQFVLEALHGYLMLGRSLIEQGHGVAEAWNFGPSPDDVVSVGDVAALMHREWDRAVVRLEPDPSAPHEAKALRLDSTKAHTRLGWKPVLSLAEAVALTVQWYRRFYDDPTVAAELVTEQLRAYGVRSGAELP
jgi:CDP-glucose 4,6-dehydratase